MSVALDNVSTVQANGAAFSAQHLVSGADRLMTFEIQVQGGQKVSNVSYAGVAATLLDSEAYTGGEVETWYLIAPTLGTNTWNVTMGTSGNCVIGVRSWTGVQQTTPIAAHAKATGATSPAAASVTSTPGGMVVDNVAALQASGETITPANGQTQDWNLAQGGAGGVIGGGSHKTASGGSDTMSWTISLAGQWAIIVVAIQAKKKQVSAAASLSVSASAAGPRVRDAAMMSAMHRMASDIQGMKRRIGG